MKKTILASVIAALISTSVFADTATVDSTTGMGILQNEWV